MTDTTAATTPNPPPTGGGQPDQNLIERFLSAFKKKKKPPKNKWTMSPKELLKEGDVKTLVDRLQIGGWPEAEATAFRKNLITTKKGRKTLVQNPDLAAFVLSEADSDDLDDELFQKLGGAKNDILSNALVMLTRYDVKRFDTAKQKGEPPFDPKLFKLLAKEVPTDVWNDDGLGLGQKKRGLGPNVLSNLFDNGAIDEICELIDKGVKTDIAAQTTKSGGSAYSGFVMPLEHAVQKHLHDVAKLGTKEAKDWSDKKRERVEGAKKVLAKLESSGKAQAVSSWSDVTGSQLIAEFEKTPGTIWGFENIREPYVEAAHTTKEGGRPIRMMELWDAVKPTIQAKQYDDFLSDPKGQIDKLVDAAVKLASDGIDEVNKDPNRIYGGAESYKEKFKLVRHDKANYLKNLKVDARKFLESYARQMPRGTMARNSLDDPNSSVSKLAGVDQDKFMGSAACKAGLHFAKDEGKPVYYCLDGINMDDAADYKKVRNKAVEEYLASGNDADTFKEVITMKEVREILRSWDDLKFADGSDVVKFVRKGKIMSADGARDFVAAWQAKMAAANKEAGRRPAPARASFAKELAAIDPGLPARLDAKVTGGTDEKTVDMDARDIVRKAGYLLRVSNTNPEYVVKYLMAKCDVLVVYGLVPGDLVAAAADFGKRAYADPPASGDELKKAADALRLTLKKKCAPQFRVPLAQSLIKHPLLARSKMMKKMVKGT